MLGGSRSITSWGVEPGRISLESGIPGSVGFAVTMLRPRGPGTLIRMFGSFGAGVVISVRGPRGPGTLIAMLGSFGAGTLIRILGQSGAGVVIRMPGRPGSGMP